MFYSVWLVGFLVSRVPESSCVPRICFAELDCTLPINLARALVAFAPLAAYDVVDGIGGGVGTHHVSPPQCDVCVCVAHAAAPRRGAPGVRKGNGSGSALGSGAAGTGGGLERALGPGH